MLNKFADYRPKLRNPGRRAEPTFQQVADRWWEKKSRELAFGSLKSYTPCMARAVDLFGPYKAREISAGDIAGFLNDMKDADFSAKVIANQHCVLNMIFDYYCEEYGGAVNASRMVRNPQRGRKTRRSRPTVYQRSLLDGQVSASGGGLFLGFLMYTSARKGEILALQYQDIDLERRTISISKSVTYMGNAPIVTKTKTENSIRENPILEPFLPVLEQAFSRQHKKTDYLIGGPEPITSSRFNKMWLDLLEPIGLTGITDGAAWKGGRKKQRKALVTPHQLRHEYAYSLYKAGVPELLAKTLMGHSDIRTTHNIYTELGQQDITDSARLLNAYYEARDVSEESRDDY